jgi:hypothetical protein
MRANSGENPGPSGLISRLEAEVALSAGGRRRRTGWPGRILGGPTPGPRRVARRSGGVGRGSARRVVRSAGRGHGRLFRGQTQVAQVAGDALGIPHQRDDFHLASAAGTGLDVDTELAHEPLPGDVAAAMRGRPRVLGHGQRVGEVFRRR